MKFDNLFIMLILIGVVVIFIAGIYTYFITSFLSPSLTGWVTTGEANLTVEQNIEVNFTTRAISWGAGKVDADSSSAALTTYGTNNVTNGNWTLTTAGGLRLRNEGNINVTLNLSVGKSAANFIGGTNPVYQWNISQVETGSCVNSTGGTHMKVSSISYSINLSKYHPANTSQTWICGNFTYVNGADEIRIDFNLTIPEDASTGARGDVITATAWVNQ